MRRPNHWFRFRLLLGSPRSRAVRGGVTRYDRLPRSPQLASPVALHLHCLSDLDRGRFPPRPFPAAARPWLLFFLGYFISRDHGLVRVLKLVRIFDASIAPNLVQPAVPPILPARDVCLRRPRGDFPGCAPKNALAASTPSCRLGAPQQLKWRGHIGSNLRKPVCRSPEGLARSHELLRCGGNDGYN